MNQIPATTFNFWTLLFGGFAFIGLFYSIKLFTTRSKDIRDILLGTYILLQSLALLEYVLYWTNLIFSVHGFCDLSLLFPLLYGPLLYVYFERSFGNEKPVTEYFIHFVPFIALLILKVPFYFSSPEFKFYHTHHILFGKFFHYYYPWIRVCHLTTYCVVLYAMIKNQSGVGFMRTWARWVVGFFSAYVVLSVTYEVIISFNLLTNQLDYFVSLATTATIFFIAWYGKGFAGIAEGLSILDSLKPPIIQSDTVKENSEPDNYSSPVKYKNSGLPKTLEVRLSQDLEKLMQDHKLYAKNDLKLETLAERLNTSKHFISQVINEVYKVNFFEYINLKRIEEAKQLLRSQSKKDLTIIEVAYEVGFNNKGTFNSVFKKMTGLTPTEFRKQPTQSQELHSGTTRVDLR